MKNPVTCLVLRALEPRIDHDIAHTLSLKTTRSFSRFSIRHHLQTLPESISEEKGCRESDIAWGALALY